MMQVRDELVDIHYSHLMNINSPHLMNVPLSGKCYHYDVSQPCVIKLINLSARVRNASTKVVSCPHLLLILLIFN